jgi:hypothetical protein
VSPKVSGRPVGWGPEAVLAWLKANPAGTPKELCEEVASRCDPVVSGQTVYADVCKWRRYDERFRIQYNMLVGDRKVPPAVSPASRDAQDPDWRQKWALAYLKSRSYADAATAAGLDKGTLTNKRTPGNPQYDHEFYLVWKATLEAIREHYEDVLNWAVDEAQAQGDPKTAGGLAVTVLERVDKARWSRSEERLMAGTVKHEHEHRLVLTTAQEAARRQAELTSQRLFGPPALPSGERETLDVVDGELVKDQAG